MGGFHPWYIGVIAQLQAVLNLLLLVSWDTGTEQLLHKHRAAKLRPHQMAPQTDAGATRSCLTAWVSNSTA